MHNLVKIRLRQVLLENVQQADKLYFNSGKLSPEIKEEILSITGGDNYTRLVADLAFHFLKFGNNKRLLEIFYDYLVSYDKNVFPVVGDLFDYGISDSNDFHILNLFALLQKRNDAVDALRTLPSIAIRNLKGIIKKPQNNEFAYKEITDKLNELNGYLKVIPDNEKGLAIKNKIFTSKNGLDDMVAIGKQFQYNFASGEELPRDEIVYLAHHNGSDIIQDTNEILVVRVNSSEAMQELSCTSLWCFSRPNSLDFWYQYAPEGFLYLIFDYTKEYDDATFMLVYLPDSGSVYASSNVPLENLGINMHDSDYLESIGVIMKTIYNDSQDLSRGERAPEGYDDDDYEVHETLSLVKKLLRERLNDNSVECVSVDTLNQLRVQGKSKLNIDLEKSIDQHGIQEPLRVIYHVHDNKAALSDGHHRLDIAMELGLQCVPTKVIVSGLDAPINAIDVIQPDWKGRDELKPSEIGLR
jgi:hypothetical protein